jgi:hypothetical protein
MSLAGLSVGGGFNAVAAGKTLQKFASVMTAEKTVQCKMPGGPLMAHISVWHVLLAP